MTTKSKVEDAIAALEAAGVDITATYAAWRDVGFALTSEFGEAANEYFHRISRLYPQYDQKACEEQFQRCLKSTGQGIGIGTFFHLVKEAGVDISRAGKPASEEPASGELASGEPIWGHSGGMPPGEPPQEEGHPEPEEEELPQFPESLYQQLPEFLQKLVSPAATPHERDMLLLGSLAMLSACFPNVHGYYDGKKVMANLYIFITAKASSGKGILSLLKKVVQPLHGEKRQEAERLQQEAELASENGEKQVAKPREKMLFLPANSSATGMFQLLHDNNGQGLIYETEGDTLSQVFRQDYGNYSDGFRKAFHHETISYYRRTEREYVDIEAPCLSALLSGTPQQVHTLIPGPENGLFSRFLFYHLNIKPEWKDVFADYQGKNSWQHYKDLGDEFYKFWKSFPKEELSFSFNFVQRAQFNAYFRNMQKRYYGLFSEDYLATIRRLGLMGFRMAMIFSCLRMMDRKQARLECREDDFKAVLEIISVLVHHSSRIFRSLPLAKAPKLRRNLQEQFLDALPEAFSRPDYQIIGSRLGIGLKSLDRYMGQFVKAGLVERPSRSNYLLTLRWNDQSAGRE